VLDVALELERRDSQQGQLLFRASRAL
jgi:hypothetical protein